MHAYQVSIFIAIVISFALSLNGDRYNVISNEIKNNMNINHVTIFTQKKTDVIKSFVDDFFGELISRVPVVSIDVSEAKTIDKEKFMKWPAFKNPRLTT